MGDTDSPDFNKARGFLIGYSLVVALLWFFGADLTQFKLMGNEIYLKENIRHVWLVIALINFYLWIRFLQRLPKRGLRFDENMHEALDAALIKICSIVHKRVAFRKAASEGVEKNEGELVNLQLSGVLSYRDELEHERGREFGPTGPWDYSYPYRAKVNFSMYKKFDKNGEIVNSYGASSYEATPNLILYRAAVVYAFLKGVVGLTWFTDNVWPLLFGCLSIGVAVFKWWQINSVVHVTFVNAFNQTLTPL
ncbi:hypothetical protein BIV08_04240 [Pseudomonas sp. AF76]|uniref:hypothetical protein n=1 Tax=Pseudomonas sp. AF76 TaxID=554393 RepID=UPI000F47C450|nr:hypothetical protein [Pseudomonas sp. AF76]ROO35369.1 hypothetical protein BIV08_04240 [Pseudomonas sp. AF76]